MAVTAGLGGTIREDSGFASEGSSMRPKRGVSTFPGSESSFSPSHDIVYDTEQEDLLHPNTLRIDLFSQGTLIESGSTSPSEEGLEGN